MQVTVVTTGYKGLQIYLLFLCVSESLVTVVTRGYRYIFYCWTHPKAWLHTVVTTGYKGLQMYLLFLGISESLLTVVTAVTRVTGIFSVMGYTVTRYRYIFSSWVYPEPWLQWLQLVPRVTGIFLVMGYIKKLGYSGYKWLQGVTGILSVMGYLIKLGYSGYNW